MGWTWGRRTAARRATALAIALLVLGVLALALGPRLGTGAQGVSTADSGFVGSWRVTPTIEREAATALISFTADGIVLASNRPVQVGTPGLPAALLVQSLGHGEWRPTGERTAEMTFVMLQTDTSGLFLGTRTIRSTLELAADGNAWTGASAVTVADPTGAVVQQTSATLEATRIALDAPPPGAAGTPTAAGGAAGPGALDAAEIGGEVDRRLRLSVDEVRAISSIPPQEVTVT